MLLCIFSFQSEMFHNHHEETCKNEVCEDSEECNCEKRTAKAVAECDEDDTGSNLTTCEHTDTESKSFCEASVSIEEYWKKLTDV